LGGGDCLGKAEAAPPHSKVLRWICVRGGAIKRIAMLMVGFAMSLAARLVGINRLERVC